VLKPTRLATHARQTMELFSQNTTMRFINTKFYESGIEE
jgi:hypothetical protein